MTFKIINTATKQTTAFGLSLNEAAHFIRTAPYRAVMVPCKL